MGPDTEKIREEHEEYQARKWVEEAFGPCPKCAAIPHDFGWALRQMRAGQICTVDGTKYCIQGNHLREWAAVSTAAKWVWQWVDISEINADDVLRTDWAVCADPEGVE